MATIHHDRSDRMPDLEIGDTIVLENTGISGSFMPRGWRYRGEKTFDGYGSTITETIGFDNFNDIPLQRMEDADDAEPVGRYIFVKYPATTPQWLAVAVIKGEPCGRELVDCLIEEGVVDPESALAEKVKADTLEKVRGALQKLISDETVTRMGVDQQSWIDAGHRIGALSHLLRLVDDLA
jgi:hypothetical protein